MLMSRLRSRRPGPAIRPNWRNAVENLIGSMRRGHPQPHLVALGRPDHCWRALGVLYAEQNSRCIRGYRYLLMLACALHHDAKMIDQTEEAAQ